MRRINVQSIFRIKDARLRQRFSMHQRAITFDAAVIVMSKVIFTLPN